MTLAHEIQKFQQEMLGQISEEVLELFNQKTRELIQTGIAEKALHTGDQIPSFSLPDILGKYVDSAQLLASGPLVINFFRGSW